MVMLMEAGVNLLGDIKEVFQSDKLDATVGNRVCINPLSLLPRIPDFLPL